MTGPISSAWESQRESIGALIRSQRELANMSLRELSRMTHVSNAYLSQIERGRNDPTLRVLLQIGDALELSVEEMLERGAGRTTPESDGDRAGPVGVEAAVLADPRLTDAEKQALTAVYRSYVRSHADDSGPEGITAEA